MSRPAKPDFFVIGAPKCGTSSFINTLRWHSRIYVPNAYEPQYFATDFSGIDRASEAGYLRLFRGVTDQHQAVGEKSVIYLYSEVAIENIQRFNPDYRLIVMLRNPVDLVYSWHSQLYWSFLEDEGDFETAWSMQERRKRGERIPSRNIAPFSLQYKEIGMLAKYLKRVQAKVPTDRLQMIFMEDFHADPDSVFQSTLDYLGVDHEPRRDARKLNVNKRHRWQWLGKLLAHDSRTVPSKLLRRLDRTRLLRDLQLKRRLHRFNRVEYKRNTLNPAMREHLTDVFRDDVLELAELTGRDLDHWLRPARQKPAA